MSFENFVEAQLIWDESMAERAARYLEARIRAGIWWCSRVTVT